MSGGRAGGEPMHRALNPSVAISNPPLPGSLHACILKPSAELDCPVSLCSSPRGATVMLSKLHACCAGQQSQ